MNGSVLLRPARPGEAALLSGLALRSKAHWGYDAAFLAACREELSLTEDELGARRTTVAEVDGTVVGFGTLEGEPPAGEIGMLFVEPAAIGRGIGRALLARLVETARDTGFVRLHIEADPYAEEFYLAQGAVRVGEIASGSVPGRALPLLELAVGDTDGDADRDADREEEVTDVGGRVHGGSMTTTSPVTELIAVCIDTSDAARLAQFYADLAGGEVTGVYPEYGYAAASVLGSTLNFQTVADYARPQWPGQEHPQQFHLDLRVSDLDAAVEHATRLGATVAPQQSEEGGWTVMLDPDGHPFCLCPPPAG